MTAEFYKNPSYDGFETNFRILDAIEEITNSTLLDEAGRTDKSSSAYVLWANGDNDEAIISYLNKNYPDWKEYAPLHWGAGGINANGKFY